MSDHSILPPSSASRRVACPGSRALEALYPEDEESPHAREGEAAHWIAAWAITAYTAGEDILPPSTAPNGEPITQEMLEGAEIYQESIFEVLSRVSRHLDVSLLHIEERIDISTIHPDCWGTPDCWLYFPGNLHIWDYKYGHGFVEVFENWQLIEYAAGILDRLKINGAIDQHVHVTFHIVQPRSYHREGTVRTWSCMASDLRPYFNILRDAERLAMSQEATCTPSPECSYCTARHACEALQRTALSAVDLSTSNTQLELPPAAIGNELRYLRRAAELLDARITGMSEQALALIKRGKRIPHFKVEETAGRDRWRVPVEEVAVLGEMFGADLLKPRDAITPKQAIKAGLPEELVRSYLEPPQKTLKLVPENPNASRKIFGGK